MKRSKKIAKKRAAKKQASEAAHPPERIYRPFEDLAKKKKPPSEPRASGSGKEGKKGGRGADGPQAGGGTPASQPSLPGGPEPKTRTAAPRTAASKPARPAGKGASAAEAAAAEAAAVAATAADAETFAVYMAGVRALEDKRHTRIPRSASAIERPTKAAPAADLDADARARLRMLVVEGIRFETTDDGERIEGRRVEVEPREVRRLRRGQYTVDQQLDLHGMTAGDARKAIEQFIEKRKKEGDRVLRIIHGKGAHSPRGVSVLRGEIAAWLSQGPSKKHIAAFATAPEGDGGTGALLVLLMRGRT